MVIPRRYVQWLALGMASGLGCTMLFPPPAQACSCAYGDSWLVWPEDGATDVAIDGPLVLARTATPEDAGELTATLIGPDGDERGLREVRRLAAVEMVCGLEHLFLEPERPLAPKTQYTLRLAHSGDAGVPAHTAVLTTGEAAFEAEPLDGLELHYVHVAPTAECAAPECAALAQVQAELTVAALQPRWLAVRSEAAQYGYNAFPAFMEAPWREGWVRVPVQLPPNDRCVEVSVYGVSGAELLAKRLCEADACVSSDLRVQSTCEEPPFAGFDARRVLDASCEDPPRIDYGDGGPIYPDDPANVGEWPDAGRPTDGGAPDVAASAPRDDGCAIVTGGSRPGPRGLAAIMTFAALVAARVRRRRPSSGLAESPAPAAPGRGRSPAGTE